MTPLLDGKLSGAARAGACFQSHRLLARSARDLARTLAPRSRSTAELLGLGAACLRIAAERALYARDEVDAARAWRECGIGERQIRMATYRALCEELIEPAIYDRVLAAACLAARAREGERLRLRAILHLRATL